MVQVLECKSRVEGWGVERVPNSPGIHGGFPD